MRSQVDLVSTNLLAVIKPPSTPEVDHPSQVFDFSSPSSSAGGLIDLEGQSCRGSNCGESFGDHSPINERTAYSTEQRSMTAGYSTSIVRARIAFLDLDESIGRNILSHPSLSPIADTSFDDTVISL